MDNRKVNKPLKILKPDKVFIPKVDVLKDYYVSKHGRIAKASPTEITIARTLKRNNFHYIKEASFRGFGFSYSPYRFDFYLPLHGIIIEYDGEHHKKTTMKKNDKLKNTFCKINNLKIYRFNKKHYLNLETHIARLLRTLTH